MHVLTKIFVVLVSLLAVLLVPLVVVYARNEDTFKAKYERATAQTAAAQRLAAEAEDALMALKMQHTQQLTEVEGSKQALETDLTQAHTEARRLTSELAAAQGLTAENARELSRIASAVEAAQQLTESLVAEVRTQRTRLLALEREKVEMDEALRDVNQQLEVAVQARRALAEELQRAKEELAGATSRIGDLLQGGGRATTGVMQDGVAPDKNLDATVISVSRASDQVLAEIDAGSRDGVREGWVLTVGRGGNFKGKLRIINVDVNRATGLVTMESPFEGASRMVETGDTAYARVGQK